MEKEKILSLLKEYFELDETINELSNKVDISFEKGHYCDEYIKIEKKDMLVTNTIELFFHEERKNALLKYADENALQKYMKEEGYKYEKNLLENIIAKTFFIYNISKRTEMINELKFSPIYKRRFNMFEFEKLNDEFLIAYD